MSEKELKPYTDYSDTQLEAGKQVKAIEAIDDNYSRHVRDFTKWLSGSTMLFGEESIKSYFTELNNSDIYKAGTKRIKRQAVKSRVRSLYEDSDLDELAKINTFLDKLDNDPATKAPKINSSEITRDMFLSHDEIKELIEKCRSERQKLFIEFLYKTGCRVAEMCSLKVQDCTNSNLMMKCRVTGKGNKERSVRISWELFRAIEKEFQGKKYLFETAGNKAYLTAYVSNQIKKLGREMEPQVYSKSDLRQMSADDKKKAIKKNGKNISAHTMRHSHAMTMIDRYPAKLDAISRTLGHSSPSITLEMYTHHQIDDSELLGLEL